jgi:hypothetical protein
MPDQLGPSTMGDAAEAHAITGGGAADARMLSPQVTSGYVPPPAFHGRRVSWTAVTLIVIGFTAGGLALVFGPTWWLFWTSGGVAAVGGLLALATNIFEDWY